jgi:hypothetical protein
MLVPGLQPNVSSVFLSEFRLFLSGYLVHLAVGVVSPALGAKLLSKDEARRIAANIGAYWLGIPQSPQAEFAV